MSESDAEIIQHVRLMDTPTDADPRRRYTEAQLEMAIRLARRGAAMQWRPIEEAAKDGSVIAAFAPPTDGERARAILVQWTGDKIWPWEGEGNGFTAGYFTHWISLPPPPAGEQE